MITARETFTGLYAAWRLLLRDGSAVALFDDSVGGIVKSFFCAVIVLPGYILLLAAAPGAAPADVGLFRIFAVDLIAYVIGWVTWPLLMAYIAPALNRGGDYGRYIVAYNWASGPQVLLLLVVLILTMSSAASGGVLGFVHLAAIVIVLLYHLFILQVALRTSVFLSVLLMVGEFALSHFISVIRHTMLQ
jgi:hypothetical protein